MGFKWRVRRYTVILRSAPSWARVSKDGYALCSHPSRLAVKNGEHLRMTAF
jgi:hypothetical protein